MKAYCCSLLLFILLGSVAFADFYVALNGDDANPGTQAKPLASLIGARDAIRALDKIPDGGLTVWIGEGQYPITQTLKLGADDSGTATSPVVYRAMPGAEVIFDGSRLLDVSALKPVTDEATLSRLCEQARGQVMYSVITDPSQIDTLKSGGTKLAMKGQMMSLSRFPNVGFAHIDTIIDKGAVYAQGRTKGAKPTYSMDAPVGGVFSIREPRSGDWVAEFKRIQKATLSGYLSYDWYREGHRIAHINDDSVQLLEFSRYGVLSKEKIPRRLVVWNLLCEVDQPGEWYFDDRSNTLFVWPFETITATSTLGIWAGSAFAELNNAQHITIRDLTIQGINQGKAVVSIMGGNDNLIAGSTLRNSTRMAAHIEGGTNNGIRGCDIYDVSGHLHLYGGDTKTLTVAGNFAENNHMTQVQATDFYGRIRVNGVGNIFRNNLVHNAIGQIMVLGGNDHLIEQNEMFNIGTEEGDGGTIYSGASMWSYGNVFKHNFLHHLMCLPQAHPRGGIYPDDLDAGDTIIENVFYKAAHRAVLLNGGANHTVAHNVFINGYIGIYSTEAWSKGIRDQKAKFDSGELKRGDKNDHVWRTEQVVGKEGWNQSPWIDKYPQFAKVMNQPERLYYPLYCTFTNNLFCDNAENFQFRTGWGADATKPIEEVDYITAKKNRDIDMKAFENPDALDFRFKRNRNKPDIPFDKIGLYVSAYRKHAPDKTAYRSAVRKHFADRPSYDPEAKYDPATIAASIYFNTGKLIMLEQ